MDGLILLATDLHSAANPFGDYLGEILKTEGFLGISRARLDEVGSGFVHRFSVVILAQAKVDSHRKQVLREYVDSGGRLLAMRPDPDLSELFGLAFVASRPESILQYLATDPASEISRGIESSSLQYHGQADEYRLAGASPIAWLCDADGQFSGCPAITVNSFGRGAAVAFTYDLARSVALTRQGNPEWACTDERCEDGDGFEGIRPVDAFLRQTGERWVDMAKMPIPQADEQQRLLANCLMYLSQEATPLPRLWYLPDGKNAVVVLTSDGDDARADAFESLLDAAEESGGRFSIYVHRLDGDPSREQAERWAARGHEVSLHTDLTSIAARPTSADFRRIYAESATRFADLFGHEPGPSVRHHWLIWFGWVDAAEIAEEHGIRMNFDYYHGRQWVLPDGRWTQGYYTGSGLPQRFVREDGRLLNVFQSLTPWADETQLWRQGQSVEGATEVVRYMLDWAENGRYSYFVSNFHPGAWKSQNTETWARNMMAEAVRRNLPIWSGEQMYSFVSARDEARLLTCDWDGTRLTFEIETAAPMSGTLTLMLPASFAGRSLASVVCDGTTSVSEDKTIAGRNYAFISLPSGRRRFDAAYL